MKRTIFSISAAIALFVMIPVGNMFGILSDKDEKHMSYVSDLAEVDIDLSVETDSDEAIQIVPNQITTLRINATNTGINDCYTFIKLQVPEMNGHPILNITPTGNWQMIEENVYEYVVDGEGRALEAGATTPEMVSEARFYDFEEFGDFNEELIATAYAIQTDGFDDSQPADIWSAVFQAEGE